MVLKSLEELQEEIAILRAKNKEKEKLLKIASESRKDFKKIQKQRVELTKSIKQEKDKFKRPQLRKAKSVFLMGLRSGKIIGGKSSKAFGRKLLKAGKIGLKGLENFGDSLEAQERAEKARRKKAEEIKKKGIQKRRSIRKKANKKVSMKKSPNRRRRRR